MSVRAIRGSRFSLWAVQIVRSSAVPRRSGPPAPLCRRRSSCGRDRSRTCSRWRSRCRRGLVRVHDALPGELARARRCSWPKSAQRDPADEFAPISEIASLLLQPLRPRRPPQDAQSRDAMHMAIFTPRRWDQCRLSTCPGCACHKCARSVLSKLVAASFLLADASAEYTETT
jgi:hypothetical protein